MRFERLAPRPELAEAVEHLWWLEGEGDGGTQPVLPDGCMELVFQLGDVFEQQDAAGQWQRQGERLLVGQQLGTVLLRPGARVRCLGLHLRPAGLASFVAGDLRRFTGQILALDAALGLELGGLHGCLRACADFGSAAEQAQAWLLGLRLAAPEPRLQRAAEALAQGEIALPQLAAELGWSERQLRRRFETAVGLAPKRFERLLRFQRVFADGREQDALAWAEAALAGGYCDQAHFNRDFRAFTKSRPREFLRDLRPLTAFFLSESSKTAASSRR